MKTSDKIITWAPRILAIIFILFLALFSLDVFAPGATAWQIAGGLLIHNIPSLVLLIVLIISWKRELIGGIVFTLAGLLYIALLVMDSSFKWYMLSWAVMISGPALLTGGLFLVSWQRKQRSPRLH
jgi:hypothetical protein